MFAGQRQSIRTIRKASKLLGVDVPSLASHQKSTELNVDVVDDLDEDDDPFKSDDVFSAQKIPTFSGGNIRRRGQRLGFERRHMSTSSISSKETGQSMMGSFSPGSSLFSFTGTNSFDSTGENINVGNLVFCTDEEVAQLMYGDEQDKECSSTEKKPSSMMDSTGSFDFEHSQNTGGASSGSSTPKNLAASLPPSAILGTGSFSTVRLAWRKTSEGTKSASSKQELTSAPPSIHPNVNAGGLDTQVSRNIVRAKNQFSHGGDDKGEPVAVKIIQSSILKQTRTMQMGPNNRMVVTTAYDNIEREIATMKRLRHPNLVRLFEVIDSAKDSRLYLVLEYVMYGEILSHVEGTNRYIRKRYRSRVHGLNNEGFFDEEHAALYFCDIMHGLAHLHRHHICHRDLKPENILLCHSGIAKISDFGVAHMFEDEGVRESIIRESIMRSTIDDSITELRSDRDDDLDDTERDNATHLSKQESDTAFKMSSKNNKGMLNRTEGTYCFWSPEMCSIDSSGFSGYASDLWAAGICLYIFASGRLPFFSKLPSDLFAHLAKAAVPYEDEGLQLFSPDLKDLLTKVLTRDPKKRAGVGDCLQHQFCAKARIRRIHEIGDQFNESDHHIILSKDAVDNALSTTMRIGSSFS